MITESFDFTDSKSGRPSVARIIAAWKKAGKPDAFTVEYGETFASFVRYAPFNRWTADGNGCRGVERDKVEKALQAISGPIGRAQ